MPIVKIQYKTELNAEQWQVVQQGDGPVLVLAGAGSGKTRTLTYRVAYLLEQGILPQEILLLTFTNKAAKEMLSRVGSLLKQNPAGLWGGTFHSVANRLLRRFALEAGYTPHFTILDQDDSHLLMKVCLKELKVDTTAKRFPSPAKLCGMISYARNAGKSVREVVSKRYANFFELIPVIERLFDAYDTHKRQADAMDFDDLLFHLRRILAEQPLIRRQLSNQFRYILVDEYQDTNIVQADIIRFLGESHGNVLVVGDDAQSIYSFRAAEIRNILRFPETYVGAKTFRLTTNYRSTPQILDVANHTIRKNPDQFKKTLTAVEGNLMKPQLVSTANVVQEARYIASRVLQFVEQGAPLSQIAVLFRAAFHSQMLEFELMKQDILYEYRGGLKFFERAHVKDVIAHLRVRANPKDEAAWLRVLGLQQGVGLATAQMILRCVQGANDLSDVCQIETGLPKRALAGWTTFVGTLGKLCKQTHPSELIRTVISGDYRTYLEAEYPDFADRLEDLEQFALFAEHAEDLQSFLNDVSLTDDYGTAGERGNSREERMVLSTIHQAKGLEWDTVFVMQVVDGKFPNPRALEEDGGIQEERRLFYVATTRARKRLVFTYPLTSGFDTLVLHQPSLFLQELPEKLFEQVQQRSNTFPASSGMEDESVIVFDALGETIVKSVPVGKTFLRNIDEL